MYWRQRLLLVLLLTLVIVRVVVLILFALPACNIDENIVSRSQDVTYVQFLPRVDALHKPIRKPDRRERFTNELLISLSRSSSVTRLGPPVRSLAVIPIIFLNGFI